MNISHQTTKKKSNKLNKQQSVFVYHDPPLDIPLFQYKAGLPSTLSWLSTPFALGIFFDDDEGAPNGKFNLWSAALLMLSWLLAFLWRPSTPNPNGGLLNSWKWNPDPYCMIIFGFCKGATWGTKALEGKPVLLSLSSSIADNEVEVDEDELVE